MSEWALQRSQRGLQTYVALFALLALAAAALVAGAISSNESPKLSLPAGAPSAQSPAANPPAGAAQAAKQSPVELPLAFVQNEARPTRASAITREGAGHAFYFTPDKAVLTFTKKHKGVALHLTPLGASPDMRLVAGEPGARARSTT